MMEFTIHHQAQSNLNRKAHQANLNFIDLSFADIWSGMANSALHDSSVPWRAALFR